MTTAPATAIMTLDSYVVRNGSKIEVTLELYEIEKTEMRHYCCYADRNCYNVDFKAFDALGNVVSLDEEEDYMSVMNLIDVWNETLFDYDEDRAMGYDNDRD